MSLLKRKDVVVAAVAVMNLVGDVWIVLVCHGGTSFEKQEAMHLLKTLKRSINEKQLHYSYSNFFFKRRDMSIPQIVSTVVHLKDLKGWEKVEYVQGNIERSRWFIRRRMTYRDIPFPITRFQQPDYPEPNALKTMEYEFELVDARMEPVDEKCLEAVKHLYFEEIP